MENITKQPSIFKLREPINALTHSMGFIACIPVLITLIVLSKQHATLEHLVSLTIFGTSLLMLYGASSIYHALTLSEKGIAFLRRIDHMMIFVLIAGTYTPICVVTLKESYGGILLVLVWVIAIAGILLKIFWFQAPRWLSTGIYVLMGWIVVFLAYPLGKALPFGGILLLVLGGIAYTIGAVIYAIKKPKLPFVHFGFHEIFHIFVMIGSAFHIIFMYIYLL